MKLYDGGACAQSAPRAHFSCRKGIDVPLVPVDMAAMGHRSDEVSSRNRCRNCGA